MTEVRRYTATLRCRTWHTWPETTHFGSKGFRLKLSDDSIAVAGVAVASYLARSVPHDYTPERADVGPLVWRGNVPGLCMVRDAILKAPEDTVAITCEQEPPRKGEVDILVAVDLAGELPNGASDLLRSIAFAFLSLLNLRLGDHLTPCAPLQVSCALPNGRQFDNAFVVAVEKRDELPVDSVQNVLCEFFDIVRLGSESAKVQTALELYGSHFFEAGAKTRFLLLVMAIEALTSASVKHSAALHLLDRWQIELDEERERFSESTPEFAALDALERELLFRREDSIRSQVRQLFARVLADDPTRFGYLPGLAVKVYDKRSALVHDGTLPTSELVELEIEARELVQAALRFLLAETKTLSAG
jgi:hypothetical protein